MNQIEGSFDLNELPPDMRKEVLARRESAVLRATISYFAGRKLAEITIGLPTSSPLHRETTDPVRIGTVLKGEIEAAVERVIVQSGQLPWQTAQDVDLAGQPDPAASLVFEVLMYRAERDQSEVSISAPDTRDLRRLVAGGLSLRGVTKMAISAIHTAIDSEKFRTAVREAA
jgi:hypothetical protein